MVVDLKTVRELETYVSHKDYCYKYDWTGKYFIYKAIKTKSGYTLKRKFTIKCTIKGVKKFLDKLTNCGYQEDLNLIYENGCSACRGSTFKQKMQQILSNKTTFEKLSYCEYCDLLGYTLK